MEQKIPAPNDLSSADGAITPLNDPSGGDEARPPLNQGTAPEPAAGSAPFELLQSDAMEVGSQGEVAPTEEEADSSIPTAVDQIRQLCELMEALDLDHAARQGHARGLEEIFRLLGTFKDQYADLERLRGRETCTREEVAERVTKMQHLSAQLGVEIEAARSRLESVQMGPVGGLFARFKKL